ncbi:MAG: multicopper oxidase domain-containing protein [Candidatus Thiodiazotropha sp.]
MKLTRFPLTTVAASLTLLFAAGSVSASQFYVQCPEDPDGAITDPNDPGIVEGDLDSDGIANNDYACIHVVGTDGYNMMADGRRLYTFGFENVTPTAVSQGGTPRELTGVPPEDFMKEMQLGGNQPAPTVVQREGQRWFITLSNFPFTPRPDLFDAHTIHYHGFANANNFYDGVPEMSLAPNPLASLAYFYNLVDPGTYFYHCHVEATEHMQMGMFANLWVEPRQNQGACAAGYGPVECSGGYTINPGNYVYNDGDGTTAYNDEMPLMMLTYDAIFHDASESVQPLDFLGMKDDYLMFNGRGYPDTVNPDTQIPNGDTDFATRTNLGSPRPADVASDGQSQAAQKLPSIIDIVSGETFLVRLSNLSTTDILTLHSPAVPMRIVGTGARELRDEGASPNGGDTGIKRHFRTHSATLGGGRSYDILLDTAGIPTGTYFLYVSNLEFLSNNEQDIGGGMTEIRIN